ncbi:MAG: DUF169 domain-containing protein [Methanomassiliicoccales archaeon]|nr:DUF169 domain-containing protein [Methanomassiliicoccales archaeon]TFG57350.1 MAG: hypothetical protein E4H30_00745 [Methanomassiliicoccus sp.]
MSDYSALAREMKETLGLKHEPVAITLIKKGSAMPADYPVTEKPVRHCGTIMRARKGEMLLVPTDKEACPVGASALGMVPVPEKVASGEFHHNMGMYKDPAAAKATLEARPSFPLGSVVAVAAAPLGKATLVPDVIVITALPEQAFWLIPASSTYEKGGRVTVEMAAVQASCADATIVPIVTGNTNISLGCFGCRKTTDIGADEMLVGIPFSKLEATVTALKAMGVETIPKSRAKA